jgi:hypothetical protein
MTAGLPALRRQPAGWRPARQALSDELGQPPNLKAGGDQGRGDANGRPDGVAVEGPGAKNAKQDQGEIREGYGAWQADEAQVGVPSEQCSGGEDDERAGHGHTRAELGRFHVSQVGAGGRRGGKASRGAAPRQAGPERGS